jgi:hypothetical protein
MYGGWRSYQRGTIVEHCFVAFVWLLLPGATEGATGISNAVAELAIAPAAAGTAVAAGGGQSECAALTAGQPAPADFSGLMPAQ